MLVSKELNDFKKVLWSEDIQRIKHIPRIRELLDKNVQLYDKLYELLEEKEKKERIPEVSKLLQNARSLEKEMQLKFRYDESSHKVIIDYVNILHKLVDIIDTNNYKE